MSIEAHPNLHAVNFLVRLAEPVLRENRIPTDDELDQALAMSVRGKATFKTDIDWPGMKESFRLIMAECDRGDILESGEKMRKRIITSFVHEVSCRLDEAVAR